MACTNVVYDHGWLRYTPARGFGRGDSKTTFLVPYSDVESVSINPPLYDPKEDPDA